MLTATFSPNLVQALLTVNSKIRDQLDSEFTVAVINDQVELTKPLLLHLRNPQGTYRKIGLVHMADFNSDEESLESIARTTNKLADVIFSRVCLFLDAEKQGFYITKKGSIFNFGDVNVKVRKGNTFAVEGNTVTFLGKPLKLTKLITEGMFEFKKHGDLSTELVDSANYRPDKRMWINSQGQLYRA